MASFPKRWCGYLCHFGETDGTGICLPDRKVVGGQRRQRVVMVPFENKYCLCNRLHTQAKVGPAKNGFSHLGILCLSLLLLLFWVGG